MSGGPDSIALLHAAATAGSGVAVSVATVDHRLRPGSAREAKAVGKLARSFGLPHHVLDWDSPSTSGIQAAARAARYRLLQAYAAERGAAFVLTGHNADDQAETVLMRLIAGSGPAGLAGMRAERDLSGGITLARPFLAVSKADLVAYCHAHGLPFVQDPSNADDRYGRARLRALMPRLADEGLTVDRLCRLAHRSARDDEALTRTALAALTRMRRVSDRGALALDGWQLRSEPVAIAVRIVDLAIESAWEGPGDPVPRRLERTERLVLDGLLPALASGARLRRTLRGIAVEVRPDGEVRFARAPARRAFGIGRDGASVAGRPDLLGNAQAAAYIVEERVE